MKESMNFLMDLHGRFVVADMKHKEKGEEPNRSVHFYPEWLYSKDLSREAVLNTMSDILEEERQNLSENDLPERASDIVARRFENLKNKSVIIVKGNDKDLHGKPVENISKFIITDEERVADVNGIRQVTSEDFVRRVYIHQKAINIRNLLVHEHGVPEEEAQRMAMSIATRTYNEQEFQGVKGDINHGLATMTENAIKYLEYLDAEKKGIENPQFIEGGMVNAAKDETGPHPRVRVEPGGPRPQNETTDFDALDQIYRAQKLAVSPIRFNSIDDKGRITTSNIAYIIDLTEKKGGYLIVCEPTVPLKSSRLIFFPQETLEDTLVKGETADAKFWTETAKDFIEMAHSEFTDGTYRTKVMHHTENYYEIMRQIASGASKVGTQNTAVYQTFGRTQHALYAGLMEMRIPSAAEKNGITNADLEEARELLGTGREERKQDQTQERIPHKRKGKGTR